jgi:hypothetical protein
MRKHWFIAAAAAALLAACGDDNDKAPEAPPEIPPNGVVGAVSDASGARVGGGTIYFVPSADVAALPATTVAVGSANDEPLEDLVAANGASYAQAAVGADGAYRLETLPQGSYFVTFVPATDDAAHLPGGSACRKAKSSGELIGKRLDLEVSAATPADATFVGSGKCAGCHADQVSSEKVTMHRLGIFSPYEAGPMQDFSVRQAELFQALTQKFEANGGAGRRSTSSGTTRPGPSTSTRRPRRTRARACPSPCACSRTRRTGSTRWSSRT